MDARKGTEVSRNCAVGAFGDDDRTRVIQSAHATPPARTVRSSSRYTGLNRTLGVRVFQVQVFTAERRRGRAHRVQTLPNRLHIAVGGWVHNADTRAVTM